MKNTLGQQTGKGIGSKVVVEGLFHTVKDGLLLYLDNDKGQVFVNNSFCALFGYECELIFRGGSIGIIPPDLLRTVQKDLPHLFENTHSDHASVILDLVKQCGKKITVNVDRATLDSTDGRLCVFVLRDITWLKILEKHKKQAESILRHDLRNYVLAIERLAESINSQVKEETVAHLGKMLVRRCESLSNIIENDLQNFQLEDGTFNIKRENCNINDILASVISQFETGGENPDIVLSYHHETKEDGYNVYYKGDSLLIERMLFNLIKNAFEASSTDECIEIMVDENQDEVSIIIKNPRVIPKELRNGFMHERITTKEGGHGLGAYSARLIAEGHGGTIEFDTSEKKGTQITVKLTRPDEDMSIEDSA